MSKPKVVVFDLDETLGYFYQYSIFRMVLKNLLNPSFQRNNIFKCLNYSLNI